MRGQDASNYRFAGFSVDPNQGRLFGPNGEIALRPKSLDVLLVLLRNAGRVVSKDELLRTAWNGLSVSEESLSQCIHDIRRALGDTAQKFVRTVPRRGYMLAVDGSAQEDSPAALPAAIGKLDSRVPIAVLPFESLSGDGARDYHAAGITEDITTALSRIGELFVVAPTQAYAVQNAAAGIVEIGAGLQVRYVLRGSVRVVGDRMRVTVKLSDASRGQTLWAENYDGVTTDLFGVKDSITRAVALAIQVKLTFGDLAHLWEGQTRILRAWEKMVQGRNLFLMFNPASNREAERVLSEAIAIDPHYTGALVQLGLCFWWRARYLFTEDKDQNLERAAGFADRALAVDPSLGSAHMLKGGIAFLRDQHGLPLEYCEKAVALAPSDSFALAYLGLVCSYSRQPRRGVDALRTAIRLCPQPLAWYYESLSTVSLWAGELEAAIESAELNFRLEPEEPLSYIVLATAYGFAGRDDDARRAVSDLRLKFPAYSMQDIATSERYAYPEDLEKVMGVLRRAGLPET